MRRSNTCCGVGSGSAAGQGQLTTTATSRATRAARFITRFLGTTTVLGWVSVPHGRPRDERAPKRHGGCINVNQMIARPKEERDEEVHAGPCGGTGGWVCGARPGDRRGP